MKVGLADSMVVGNEDIIDEEGKNICTAAHTVEIGVCAKPRLMPSGHLACHFVTEYSYYLIIISISSRNDIDMRDLLREHVIDSAKRQFI